MKLNADTSEVVWSTLIGGNAGTEAATIAVDGSENVYVQGRTSSTTGLIGPGGLQPTFGGGTTDIFLIQIKQEVRARIEVLPTTTRWRPQRDHSTDATGNPVDPDPLKPVVINFTAPKGYTPMSLEITDPTGALLVSPSIEIAGPIDPKADPGQYTIKWSGPWSLTDPTTGELKYQASGNYTFKIRGTKADGTALDSDPTKPCADAAAGTPTCSIVSLVEVTAVTMMDKPRTRGRVPNRDLGGPGGGWAIFPEARNPSPNDQVGDEDKVEIVATVSPAVPDPRTQGAVTVHFRGLDVDDPSAGLDPVTGTSSSVDNEALAQDNCPGGGCAVPSAGNVNGQSADAPVPAPLTAGQTQVAVDFQVSDRQGDNYRVAASTSSSWLGTDANGLSARQNSTFGEVIHSSGEPVLDPDDARGPQVSEMLTVWRTLHLEVDHLDSSALAQTPAEESTSRPIVLDLTGNSTNLAPHSLTDDNQIFRVPQPKNLRLVDHSRNDDWAGAHLWPLATIASPTNWALVVGNGKNSVDTENTAADLTNVAKVGDPYRLSDDERVDLTGDLPLGFTTNLLKGLYIRVEALDSLHNPSSVQTFIRNLRPGLQARLQKDVTNSPTYWSVMLVDAFDAAVEKDNDPNRENGNLGVTMGAIRQTSPPLPISDETGQDPRQPICAIFRETIRDYSDEHPGVLQDPVPILENTTAHEIVCHALGIGHLPDTLCNETHLTGNVGASFKSEQRAGIRKVKQPNNKI
jgi:hypothetical protein